MHSLLEYRVDCMQLKRGLFRSPGASPSSTESSDETDQEFDVVESPPPPFELELLEAALIVATGRLLSSKRFRHHSVTVPCEVGMQSACALWTRGTCQTRCWSRVLCPCMS